jgi:hypothetical protein
MSYPVYPNRWFYCASRVQDKEDAERVLGIIRTAGEHGFTGMAWTDFSFGRLDEMQPEYFDHIRQIKDECRRLDIEMIPQLFPIGYSGRIHSKKPNLIEGLRAEGAEFVVRDGVARIRPDAESGLDDAFDGLDETIDEDENSLRWVDAPGVSIVADTETVKEGNFSIRMQDFRKGDPEHGNCRIWWRIKVVPYRCYRMSGWIRVKDVNPLENIRIQVLDEIGRRRSLDYVPFRKAAQSGDWERFDILFNSQEMTEAMVYMGIWQGNTGTIWWESFSIEEEGLVLPIRRPSEPLLVTSDDGATTYVEGMDYEEIPAITDTEFEYHAPYPIRLTKVSNISEGQTLRVSWSHPIRIFDDQCCCCLSTPETYDFMEEQARTTLELLDHPKWVFMNHDEVRSLGTDLACRRRNMTCGEILADSVRRCTEILRRLNPDGRICVWSDMFTPTHNGVDNYFLCGSTMEGAWEGLDKDVAIVIWHAPEGTIEWFEKRGHEHISSVGMAASLDVDRLADRFKLLETAKKSIGIMYTTWSRDYRALAEFGDVVSKG